MNDELSVEAHLRFRSFRVDARFCAPANAISALFGPSGAGKSVLLDLIAGVRRLDSGRISLRNRVLDDTSAGVRVPAHERGVGLVFQDARLFPHLNVRGNLNFAASRALRLAANRTVESVAAHFDIAALLDRRIGALSGGEKARVALARSILSAPDFLLLDEPFAALDGARRAAFIATLRSMHRAFGIPMLVVTHQIDDAVALAEHIIGVAAGRVVAEGPLQDTLSSAAMRALLAKRDVGSAFPAAKLRSAAAMHAPMQWVRADHVLLAVVQPTGLSARNIWAGHVEALEQEADGAVLVQVRTEPGALFARLTADSVSELNLSLNQPIWAIVKAHSL